MTVFLVLVLISLNGFAWGFENLLARESSESIFDYDVDDGSGNKISLASLKGKKAYLIVNVASQCGFTASNYAGLVQLHEKYASMGLEILAFPCNNFGAQEPAPNHQIQQFAASRGAQFKVLGKIECSSGSSTSPLYNMMISHMKYDALTWNFFKFIADEDGKIVMAAAHDVHPTSLDGVIEMMVKPEEL
jgi:glutathione peroxidase-family protein